MSKQLGRGAAVSLVVHFAVITALLVGVPATRPADLPEEEAVAMVFEGNAPSAMRAERPAPVPAPAPAAEPTP
ncbi:MAG: energy transducer TonB, partial [Acetobacteraceae bacterium]|nr:energy transducer TonB [Acetobacteraceae bacterium]